MYRVEQFYHVTKEKHTKRLIEQNGWRLYNADDIHYDGPLADGKINPPKGVFFNFYTYKGKLPPKSVYPREADKGTESPRLSIPIKDFGLENYELFLAKKPTKGATSQVHVVLVDYENKESLAWCKKHLIFLNPEDNKFFMKEKGDWYSTTNPKIIVNVFIIPGKYGLPSEGKWDYVEKR